MEFSLGIVLGTVVIETDFLLFVILEDPGAVLDGSNLLEGEGIGRIIFAA